MPGRPVGRFRNDASAPCDGDALGFHAQRAHDGPGAAGRSTSLARRPGYGRARNAQAVVDVPFVDEAGQLALGDVLAVPAAADSRRGGFEARRKSITPPPRPLATLTSLAVRPVQLRSAALRAGAPTAFSPRDGLRSRLVLLGDPQQLEQPRRATHPEGSDVSALGHVLGDAATIADDRGIFGAETWRLPPKLCALTSELYYDGKLRGIDKLRRRALVGTGELGLEGAGLWWLTVEHEARSVVAPEEVTAVRGLVSRPLEGRDGGGSRGVSRQPGVAQSASAAARHAERAASVPRGKALTGRERFTRRTRRSPTGQLGSPGRSRSPRWLHRASEGPFATRSAPE